MWAARRPAWRREALALGGAAAALAAGLAAPAGPARATQGYTAGRIPGLSKAKDGWQVYTRPEGKQGGHGVGWSEIPPYSFQVPEGWQETPVSIADGGGTEIDVRFQGEGMGSMFVVVAPVLRFTDAGFGADVRIKDIGPPEKLLGGFAPEILGGPLEDRDLESTVISSKETPVGELDFYNWVTNRPRAIMSATSYKNRAFVLCVKASALQWRKNEEALRKIGDSFSIVA